MNELIKYFENIEARLAALEAAEQAESAQEAKLQEQDNRLTQQAALIATLSAKIVALEAQIKELEARPVCLPETPVVTEAPEEEETIAIDEETGKPELEVEFEEPTVGNSADTFNEEETIATDETGAPELEVEFEEEPEEEAAPIVETPAPTPAEELIIVADEPAPHRETIADAATHVTTVADAAPHADAKASIVPKLEDIKKGISLADRFLFQRELFANNGELMNKTIDKLNSLSSHDEAVAFIAQNFPNWNKESNAYELFTNLLKRRW